jgi:hypothetical protein
MVYSSSSLALAAIELFVHLEPNQLPDDLVAIAALLPEGEPAQRLDLDSLPPEWWKDDFEPLRELGDQWIRAGSSLAIEVPSAALRMDWNVLVNPLHPKSRNSKSSRPSPSISTRACFARTFSRLWWGVLQNSPPASSEFLTEQKHAAAHATWCFRRVATSPFLYP